MKKRLGLFEIVLLLPLAVAAACVTSSSGGGSDPADGEGEAIGQETSHAGVGVLYARGALISYLLDAEMVASGFRMDDLLTFLYENFGLTDTAWTQADLETALLEITGMSFSDFFDTTLDTNAFLDLEGSFETPL